MAAAEHMAQTLALIVTDLQRTRLGQPARLGDRVAGRTVLQHTLQRMARVPSVGALVIVHPADQDPAGLLNGFRPGKPLHCHADPDGLVDACTAMRRSARKWALSAWRAGLAGAACHDELLPARPLVAAMDRHGATAAVLVGGDWPLVDPDYCEQVLVRHLEHPEALALTFSQAPPGLCGLAISRDLLAQVADRNGFIGQLLAYNPAAPQADPIGRDPCIQIDPAVRGCGHRLVHDTPRTRNLIAAIARDLGDRTVEAGAVTVAHAVARLEAAQPGGFAQLPRLVTLELTTRRRLDGPIVPQHHAPLSRGPMPLDGAVRIVRQLGGAGDVLLTLGGLGDALLYEEWADVVRAAHDAGLLGVAIQTDLLVARPVLQELIDADVDVVSVRLNADTAATYAAVMGADRFREVIENLQWLLRERRASGMAGMGGEPDGGRGLPWVVPHLVKTARTLGDMETFFDRWLHHAGSAVIEPATTGCGLAPAQSPVSMAPPRRRPCRQLEGRMTILADGRVARCDQDWLGRGSAGDATTTPLAEIWQSMNELRRIHRRGEGASLPLCGACEEWHRP